LIFLNLRGAHQFRSSPFVSISNSQREPLPDLNWLDTVYGLPTDSLTPRFEDGTYLAFLGRITPDKGPEIAIRLAKAAGMPLRIAAKLPRAEDRFFREQIQPFLDGTDVQFIGEVNDKGKADLLGGAAALLFPDQVARAFWLGDDRGNGLRYPVIAYRAGSVPEVVDHGRTGFVVEERPRRLRQFRA
jgi:glycosyltransferase involved in cell wall biosynthesis